MPKTPDTGEPNPEAAKLTPQVYGQLRKLAGRYLQREGGYHTAAHRIGPRGLHPHGGHRQDRLGG